VQIPVVEEVKVGVKGLVVEAIEATENGAIPKTLFPPE
jgi:hypothetical protein